MATIGPTMPPEFLSKRKRSSSSSPPASPPAKRSRSSSPAAAPKKARAIGPSLPGPSSTNSAAPPPTDPKNRSNNDGDDDSSTDSEIGPSLPSANAALSAADSSTSANPTQNLHPDQPAKPQREDWMLAPPSSSDWTTRVDPTKLKARRFNTGKPSNPAPSSRSGEIDSLWTETPEQKRRRLEDEVVGRKAVATGGAGSAGAGSDGPGDREGQARRKLEEERRAEMERRVQEINEREGRGGSLYDAHQRKRDGKEGRKGHDKDKRDNEGKEGGKSKERWQEEEDDPSKRGFDREKDMGLGGKVGYKARSDMTRQAKGFGGRFGQGGYL